MLNSATNTLDRVEVMGRLGRAMSDPTRARLLERLLDGPTYPAELAADLALTRSNVSNHLACLRGCGLVLTVPDGRRTRYEIADPHLAAALGELMRVVLDVRDGRECANPLCDVPGCTACETGTA
ncbi:transcriptional regulator, ArsR family [Beutenbergia cavernae DSM 12333]|uniref:Transcriptional regulator, ArsR family n=1 Tax=Beutenbergia cavernae (strain ATCC BAA-8 / DSM 12333 / CCUG 43141 / JCM 11478 / NBRC 16432 / NCIMB 13614 / HKI 0122) TaxID=471853 RepID=C5BXC7_BEUC1|nr:metalloregulator ArsR/SmtB family transcription factor [Beutenbergia cavernae]ACQ78802.1 transcriptional regulator, ArsR family [Beutenbergia cavernae DSM 12333]